MNKNSIIAFVGMTVLAVLAYAAATNQVSHLTDGIVAQGGVRSGALGSRTLVVSGSTNLEYAIESTTIAAYAGLTNTWTFSSPFAAAPVVLVGGTITNSFKGAELTVDITNAVIILDNSNTNKAVYAVAYGYRRTGVVR